jgi:hypothetical protein
VDLGVFDIIVLAIILAIIFVPKNAVRSIERRLPRWPGRGKGETRVE